MAASLLSDNLPAPEPVFPRFKPLTLADREIFRRILWDYQAETSELTFTNLFIWQSHYGYQWSLDRDRLLVVSAAGAGQAWALPPVGPPPRVDLCRQVLGWLRDVGGVVDPVIERADPRLAAEVAGHPEFVLEPMRDHFDYVYRSGDLINLAGGKYHAQRNHINSLTRSGGFRYEPLREEHLSACLYLCARWCQVKRCDQDLSLMGEWEAIGAALANFQALSLQGGVILVNDRVEAFTCGELLNKDDRGHPPGEGQSGNAGPLRGHQPAVLPGGLGRDSVYQPGAGSGGGGAEDGQTVLPSPPSGGEIPHPPEVREVRGVLGEGEGIPLIWTIQHSRFIRPSPP